MLSKPEKPSTLPTISLHLLFFDAFKGQCTESIYEILRQNNIRVVKVPANCTDRLQPMDLSINKAIKDFMRKQLMEWYSMKVMERLSNSTAEETTAIDFKLTTMKPLIMNWMIQLFDYLSTNPSIIQNGFKAAGITESVSLC